jgi:hypothetical protein
LTTVKDNPIEGGRWQIFRRPADGRNYVMGVDTASGKLGANESCATILCVEDGRQDAICAGVINPEDMAREVEKGAYYFNQCEVGIENEKHGIVVIQYLLERKYPNIFFHATKMGSMTGTSASDYGWNPAKYRSVSIDWLITDVGNSISPKVSERQRAVFIFDPETISQLGFFIPNNKTGKLAAGHGKLDDRVSALYISNYLRRLKAMDLFAPKPLPPPQKTILDMIAQPTNPVDERNMGTREYT